MEHSAGIVPIRKGKFLLIKNTKTQEWGFPKGHLEKGESEEEAAHRELHEETGLHATLVGGFKETISYLMCESGKRKKATYFLGRAGRTAVVHHLDDVDGHKWCSYEEAKALLVHDDLKTVLEKAKAALDKVTRAPVRND
jgi:bis(5'-nucleosidyl)-tetraphosphatase